MSAVAVFVYTDWLQRYPELANTSSQQATLFFNEATLYLNNSGWGGKVQDVPSQTMLLGMLTAHIAFLANGTVTSPGGNPQVVGHLDQANQGSVSIAASVASNVPLTAAYFMQSVYGLAFWQATAQYRTASFRPNYRTPLVGRPFGGRPFI